MIETLNTQLTTPALLNRFQATFTKAFNQEGSSLLALGAMAGVILRRRRRRN